MKLHFRSAGLIFFVLLSACGSDEVQSDAISQVAPSATVAGIRAPAPTQMPSSCFEDAEGFEVAYDGTVVDNAGSKLVPLTLTSRADQIAASNEDFCGKWASEDEQNSNKFRYVFRTNPACVRRALPGDFVYLGMDPEAERNAEFMEAFVDCREPTEPENRIEPTFGEEPDPPENPKTPLATSNGSQKITQSTGEALDETVVVID